MDLVGYIITGAANILFLLSLGPWGTKRRLLWRLSSKMKSEVLESVRTHCSKIFLVFFFFSGKIIESPTLLSEASLMGSDSEPVIWGHQALSRGRKSYPKGRGLISSPPNFPSLCPPDPALFFAVQYGVLVQASCPLFGGEESRGQMCAIKSTSWFSWKREPWSGLSVPCGPHSHI